MVHYTKITCGCGAQRKIKQTVLWMSCHMKLVCSAKTRCHIMTLLIFIYQIDNVSGQRKLTHALKRVYMCKCVSIKLFFLEEADDEQANDSNYCIYKNLN